MSRGRRACRARGGRGARRGAGPDPSSRRRTARPAGSSGGLSGYSNRSDSRTASSPTSAPSTGTSLPGDHRLDHLAEPDRRPGDGPRPRGGVRIWRRIAPCSCCSAALGSSPSSSTSDAARPGGRPEAPPLVSLTGRGRSSAGRRKRSRSGCSRRAILELTDELGVPPAFEVGVDALLEGGQAKLLEARRLALWANDSYARSASAGPRQRPSACGSSAARSWAGSGPWRRRPFGGIARGRAVPARSRADTQAALSARRPARASSSAARRSSAATSQLSPAGFQPRAGRSVDQSRRHVRHRGAGWRGRRVASDRRAGRSVAVDPDLERTEDSKLQHLPFVALSRARGIPPDALESAVRRVPPARSPSRTARRTRPGGSRSRRPPRASR